MPIPKKYQFKTEEPYGWLSPGLRDSLSDTIDRITENNRKKEVKQSKMKTKFKATQDVTKAPYYAENDATFVAQPPSKPSLKQPKPSTDPLYTYSFASKAMRTKYTDSFFDADTIAVPTGIEQYIPYTPVGEFFNRAEKKLSPEQFERLKNIQVYNFRKQSDYDAYEKERHKSRSTDPALYFNNAAFVYGNPPYIVLGSWNNTYEAAVHEGNHAATYLASDDNTVTHENILSTGLNPDSVFRVQPETLEHALLYSLAKDGRYYNTVTLDEPLCNAAVLKSYYHSDSINPDSLRYLLSTPYKDKSYKERRLTDRGIHDLQDIYDAGYIQNLDSFVNYLNKNSY